MAKASNVPTAHPSETHNAGISYAPRLDDGESLTGTPTITSTPPGLTISNVQVNSTVVVIEGKSVAIGKAVLFSVSGGTSNVKYEIQATATTNASNPQTLIGECSLFVRDN